MAIKTTWTEVNQIIKEEFQRVMEKKKIQSRIQQINEELAIMEDEDSAIMGEDALEEVEAGSEMKVRSHAWTGEEDGDTKWTPKFDTSKAPALMEDDEIEVGEDDDDEEGGDLADEFAAIGAKIEAKIMAALGRMNDEDSETAEEETAEEETTEDDEEFEEVEVSDEENEDDFDDDDFDHEDDADDADDEDEDEDF